MWILYLQCVMFSVAMNIIMIPCAKAYTPMIWAFTMFTLLHVCIHAIAKNGKMLCLKPLVQLFLLLIGLCSMKYIHILCLEVVSWACNCLLPSLLSWKVMMWM
ncbi:hypothetical protein KP509_07G098400 [Ceratopteris richardii]|uniref:Uncharacterized protein n=1 Tax=Ceratopteris richardii TaxID=49495 RepID=A0A8T2UJM0_CERRI|nr:hypothetical protein KP509_07G098400 [Ceratopteris richardii]